MKILIRCLAILGIFFAIIFCGIWSLSPVIVKYVANPVLEQHNLRLSRESSVRLNPFTSTIHIYQLELLQNEASPYSLDSLVVEYKLWSLLRREVKVNSLRVQGMHIVVENQGQNWRVAGFSATAEEGVPAEEAALAQQPGPAGEEGSGFSVFAPRIHFENVVVDLYNQQHKHQLTVKALSLDHSQFVDGALATDIRLEATVDGAAIAFQGRVRTSPSEGNELGFKLEVDGVTAKNIAYLLPENIHALEGRLSVAMDGVLQQQGANITVASKLTGIQLDKLLYKDARLQLLVDNIEFSAKQLALAYNTDTHKYNVDTGANFKLRGLQSSLAKTGDTLLLLGGMNLGELSLTAKPDGYLVSTDKVLWTDILFSASQQPDLGPLFTNKALTLSGIRATNTRIDIDNVDIAEGELNLTLLKDGQLATLIDTESLSAAPQTTQPEPSPALAENADNGEPEAPQFALQNLVFSGPLSVNIADNSKEFVFKKTYVVDKLTLQKIDTANPEGKTTFNVKLKDQSYFVADIDGWIQPLLEKKSLELTAKSREFPMQDVAPYLRDSLGFEVEAGLLDLDVHTTVRENDMAGNADILMRGAKFKSSQKMNDEANLIGQTAIPLNVALNMLRDKQGNIKLKIPLKGSLDDPKFGLQHVVGLVLKKVAMQQAKSYLMATFVPYAKVVSLAITAGEEALKVRFEDLEYLPEQLAPGEAQEEFIQQFTRLMAEKDTLTIRACPIATPADIQLTAGTPLSEDQHSQLLQVAKQRGVLFKAQVVERGGIASARVLLCSEKVDLDKQAKPRIDFKT